MATPTHEDEKAPETLAIEDAKNAVGAGIQLSPEEDRRILRKLDQW